MNIPAIQRTSACVRRRGFTLIEAALIVLMLSIAIPPSIEMMTEASASRTDRILLATAMSYAQGLTDQLEADVSASGLDILADSDLYLNAPSTGLWDRMSWISEPYTTRGLSASITISALVNEQGVVSTVPAENLFRLVTVTVAVPLSNGELIDVPIPMMLAEPNP